MAYAGIVKRLDEGSFLRRPRVVPVGRMGGSRLRQESLKLRRMQMTIVERIIRPVRAATARKRKIREELLAHLETIHEEESARHNDSAAALRAAAQRLNARLNGLTEISDTCWACLDIQGGDTELNA